MTLRHPRGARLGLPAQTKLGACALLVAGCALFALLLGGIRSQRTAARQADAAQEVLLATIGRHHTRPLHLAGLSVDPLAGDLSSMLIKSHYDAHQGGLLKLHGLNACADTLRA